AIDPRVPATLYAGTAAGSDVYAGDGVFKSTDAGAHWAAANTGLTTGFVTTLAIDPLVPATLYAGTDAGVFKTTDAGAHWAAVNTGLTDLFVTMPVNTGLPPDL